jgi:hypothetical protein
MTVITIVSMIFIFIAFIVNENNAKDLLSGYNTMSEDERQNINIKSYIGYFKKFHISLGISIFTIGLILYYFINPDWSGIFIATYPVLAYVYFIWKGNKISKVNHKKNTWTSLISMSFMLAVFFSIAAMFFYSLRDNQITTGNNLIKIKGAYGVELKKSEILSVELVNNLPEISTKTNGFALYIVKKGKYKTKMGEHVKLFINSAQQPIIRIITKNKQKIYYSSKCISNKEIFDELKNEIKMIEH